MLGWNSDHFHSQSPGICDTAGLQVSEKGEWTMDKLFFSNSWLIMFSSSWRSVSCTPSSLSTFKIVYCKGSSLETLISLVSKLKLKKNWKQLILKIVSNPQTTNKSCEWTGLGKDVVFPEWAVVWGAPSPAPVVGPWPETWSHHRHLPL
jgi:hypothetical protein